jgi:hypothetical protein
MSFCYHGALSPTSELYQGRGQLLETLLAECTGEVRRYQFVYGSRQSGKTSLLLRLDSELKEPSRSRVRPCLLNFQQVSGSSLPEALRFLAKGVVHALGKAESAVPVFEEGASFGSWLAQQVGLDRLVLLFDELGALADDVRRALGNVMRSVFEARLNTDLCNVAMVFAGGIELHTLGSSANSPLQNVCKVHHLRDFTLEETTKLLRIGFKASGHEPSIRDLAAVAGVIHARVNGHPQLTQHYADLELERFRGEGSPKDIEATGRLASRLWHDTFFSHTCRGIASYRLADKVRSVLRGDKGFEADPRMQKLQLLGAVNWVDESEIWVIRNPLLRAFIEKVPDALGESGPGELAAATEPEYALAVESRYARPVVFISYARKDNEVQDPNRRWLDRLLELWVPYAQRMEVRPWVDRDIPFSADWNAEIQDHIQSAEAFVLLVGPGFLASDYVREHELPAILQRYVQQRVPVVPVILEPSGVEAVEVEVLDGSGTKAVRALTEIQGPNPGRTLIELDRANQNRALLGVVKSLCDQLMPRKPESNRPKPR